MMIEFSKHVTMVTEMFFGHHSRLAIKRFLVTTTIAWQLEFFKLAHSCGDRKPFNHHNVFPLPPPPIFSPFFAFPPLDGDQNPFGRHLV